MLGHDIDWWNAAVVISLWAAAIAAIALVVTTQVVIMLQKQEAKEAAERIAGLEKDAAAASLETERLKAQFAWRTIPPDIAARLETGLAAHSGAVNLRYTDGDPEALFLAIQFSKILTKAHWRVGSAALKLSNAIVFGIALPDANSVDAQTLRTSFSAAGLPFSTNPMPPGPGISFLASQIEGAPTLMVGSKAPALP